MRNKFRIIGVSLAAMAGLLLVSGVAWANPNKTPVWGQVVRWTTEEPGESWIDDDGVVHVRNRLVTVRLRGDIDGWLLIVENLNRDPSTGDGDNHGSFVFIGYVGEGLDWVRATGRHAGVASGLPTTWEVDLVGHVDDGRLFKMTQVAPPGGPPWKYVGEILDPPGHR